METKLHTVDLDWKNLGFGVMKTDYNVRCVYRDEPYHPPTVIILGTRLL